MNFKIFKLFEVDFIDGTSLWATVNIQNGITKMDTLCFGILGKGYAKGFKDIFNKDSTNNNLICAIANTFFVETYPQIVTKFQIFETNQKTKPCQTALQLMDEDLTYQEALNKTLLMFPEISKENLVAELNLYF